ncbi:MAG: hypothetical protein R2825_20955 [Saprospiraceae bacterium]
MKKIFLPFIFVFSALAFLTQGCYYDNVAELHPETVLNVTPCDTTATISFTNDIEPILKSSCGINNSCHGSSNTSNISLNTYTGVNAQANNGRLLSSVNWDGDASFMPKNSTAKLNDCSLTKIRLWVESGAPNN